MAGRGKVEPQDEVTNPQIYMFTKDYQWVAGRKDPVPDFRTSRWQAWASASEFARQIVAAKSPTTLVGLIPCAMGGSKLDELEAGWNPLQQCRGPGPGRRMKNGTLAGILWHQGESDSAHDQVVTYAERFATMIGQLRKDLVGGKCAR